ncbi:MAG TPA: GTP cyclohydrolase I, partial [Bacteroidales bacterium]|nr:GTP cyclohydrolase I [Bacteroidales bacterium]
MAEKNESGKISELNVHNGYNRIESWDEESIRELSGMYYRVLKLLGEDPDREGLRKTPERVAKALHFLMMGYSMDPCEIINSAKFREDYKQMVIVKN